MLNPDPADREADAGALPGQRREAAPQRRRARYSDHAGPSVPAPTVRRRERVLWLLRSADEAVTAAELAEHLRRNRLRDYNHGLALKDLGQLERYGLVRSSGHPKRWSAV